jgi:pilus assembly protein Flp/PilA
VLNTYATLVSLVAFAQDRLKRDEKGATAVEYGLMVGLIAVVIIGIVSTLGGQLAELFSTVSDELGGAGDAPAAP